MPGARTSRYDQAALRALRYAQVTIAYNVIEGLIAVTAGLSAGSVALVGFGFDSLIEVTAATVVLIQLRAEIFGGTVDERRQRRALRIIAITFFALAVYVVFEGGRDLLFGSTPQTSPAGLALTALSVVVMPLLARAKRRAGEEMGSRLVLADAAETRLCAWLSASTFAGLLGWAIAGWAWIDPVAGFVIAAFAVLEGREAWEGELACEGDTSFSNGAASSCSARVSSCESR